MLRFMLVATVLSVKLICNSQSIVVHIENIRNTEGVLRIALFQNEQQFDNSKPVFSLCVIKKGISNRITTTAFSNIAKGTYGIAILDDENSNGELDTRFFVPKEGFGFSNFNDFSLNKPEFNDFSFKTDGKQNVEVTVRVRYYN